MELHNISSNHNNKIVAMSVLMIFLVVCLPIYSAQALSANIQDAQVWGEKGHDGILSNFDSINANATIKVTDGILSATDVKIGSLTFDSCVDAGDGMQLCTYASPSKTSMLPGSQQLIIDVKDGSTTVDTRVVRFVVDKNVPTITQFPIDPSMTSGGNLKVSFTAEDKAGPSGPECAGLTEVRMVEDGSVRMTEPFLPTCLVSDYIVTVDSGSFSSGDGIKEVCLVAVDLLGHVSEESCQEFLLDEGNPKIQETTLDLIDQYGRQVRYFKEGFSTKAVINISDEISGVREDRVFGNLSSISSGKDDVRGECTYVSEDDTVTCEWQGLVITATESFNAHVGITAEDKAGNLNSLIIVQNLVYDGEGPTIDRIYSGHEYNDAYYLGGIEGSRMYAQLNDAGVGVGLGDVYANLGPLGLGGKVIATECSESGLCMWNISSVPIAHGSEVVINLHAASKDDLGNMVVLGDGGKFVIDKELPIINEIEIIDADNSIVQLRENSFVEILVNITDDSQMFATADLSELIVGAEMLSADSCEKVNGSADWLCRWSQGIGPIAEGKQDITIPMVFSDVVGNKVTIDHVVTIYEDDTSDEDYIDIKLSAPSPGAVDRQLMSLTNMKISYPIEFDGKDRALPVNVKFNGCESDYSQYLNNADPYSGQPRFIQFDDITKGIMEFSFDVAVIDEPRAWFNCSFAVVSLVDNVKLSGEEAEELLVSVEFYNPKYGELSATIEEEIEDVKDSWLVKLEFLDTLEKILGYAKMICSLINTLQTVMNVYTVVTGMWGDCCAYSGPAAGICCSQHQAAAATTQTSKGGISSLFEKLGSYCGYLDCKLWGKVDGESWYGSWINWAYETQGSNKGWLGNVNPKDSLVLSVVFLCIPGIIYNLQKARQVECQYIECLESTANGLPVKLCEEQRGYGMCKFVVGELFNWIPFAAAFSQLAQNIRAAIQNPYSLMSFAMSTACKLNCQTPGTGALCTTCSYLDFANMIIEVTCSLGIEFKEGQGCKPVWEDAFNVEDSYCARVLSDGDDDEGGWF